MLLFLFPLLLLSLAFSFSKFAPETWRWVWGTYIVPSFYPVVITCNTEDNPLAALYTLKTLEDRVAIVRFLALCLQVGCSMSFLVATVPADFVPFVWFVLNFVVVAKYYKPPTAVVLETIPHTGVQMEWGVFVDTEEAKMVTDVSKKISSASTSWVTRASPENDTIRRALKMKGYNIDSAVRALGVEMQEINKKNVDGTYVWDTNFDSKNLKENGVLAKRFWAETAEAATDTDLDRKSVSQQKIFAETLHGLFHHYGIKSENLSIVSGVPSLKPYCSYNRAPERVDQENTTEAFYLETYETWFDANVVGKSCCAAFSYGPLSSLSYGVEASPDTKMFLFGQCWNWSEGKYKDSKNSLPSRDAAMEITQAAHFSLFVPDECAWRAQRYRGDSIAESVEVAESIHGCMDAVTRQYILDNGSRGSHPLFNLDTIDRMGWVPGFGSVFVEENALVLPAFTAARALLHPADFIWCNLCYVFAKILPMWVLRNSWFFKLKENIVGACLCAPVSGCTIVPVSLEEKPLVETNNTKLSSVSLMDNFTETSCSYAFVGQAKLPSSVLNKQISNSVKIIEDSSDDEEEEDSEEEEEDSEEEEEDSEEEEEDSEEEEENNEVIKTSDDEGFEKILHAKKD